MVACAHGLGIMAPRRSSSVAEHLHGKEGVRGSNPRSGSTVFVAMVPDARPLPQLPGTSRAREGHMMGIPTPSALVSRSIPTSRARR